MRYIEQWCRDAVSYIRFPPDRPAVEQELLEHMTDKYEGYVAEGMPLNDAERRTIQEMGKARDTGLLLQKIHKPYLGWLWRFTQWVLVIALLLAFFNGIRWTDSFFIASIEDVAAPYGGVSRFDSTEHKGLHRVLYVEPGCTAQSDGYTFTVTKAVGWAGNYTGSGTYVEQFYFLLEVHNPRPWAGYTEAPRWFYAVDSLGNYYYSCFEQSMQLEPAVIGNGYQTGLNTWTFYMWIEGFHSLEAEWLELRYDRDGRDVALRIDLTGGEGA